MKKSRKVNGLPGMIQKASDDFTAAVALPRLEVRVRLFRADAENTELLGFADLVIGGAFVIKGLRVLMGKPREGEPGKPFVSYPSRKGFGASAGKYFEIAHPVTAEAREAAKSLILAAYEAEAAKEAA